MGTKLKHDSWPWVIKVEDENVYIVGKRYICEVFSWETDNKSKENEAIGRECKANAALIAAAPEMLGALICAEKELSGLSRQLVRAAIQKATGGLRLHSCNEVGGK